MKRLNICVDIDGTITSPYHFIPYLNEIFEVDITEEECTTHNWEELYGSDIKKLYYEFNEKYIYSYKEAEVVEGARDIIGELYKEHNVYFVTARDSLLTEVTQDWLNNNGFSDMDVYLLGTDYKIDKAKELNCDIFIEDNPSNSLALADEGIQVLLIDTNYNKDVEHENIVRVSDWTEIKNFVENVK